ncbi:hypothetical protein F4802DRAFT_593718 [Xylaria palmicola]|nr:hypothetical protein F4802DRAFT_593718 [Xylaria palmicola]
MARTRISTIVKRNAKFAAQNRRPHHCEGVVCVFAGAMSGIGAKTLERMLTMFYHSATFYVLGQYAKGSQGHRKRLLDALSNRGCKIVYIEADVSLTSDMDAASKLIAAAESKVDYLCMSKDDVLPNGAKFTKDGYDTHVSIWYLARMRLLSNLLPLLSQAREPRVLDILNDGLDEANEEAYKGRYGWGSIQKYSAVLTNLVFHHLALEYRNIAFILSPMVPENEETPHLSDAIGNSGPLLRAWRGVLDVARNIAGSEHDEALERHLYYLTNASYSPGPFFIDRLGELLPSSPPDQPWCDIEASAPAWKFTIDAWYRMML